MTKITRLDELSTHDLKSAVDGEKTTVVLFPIGSTEPHGPHLPLRTDVILAEENAVRAAEKFSNDFTVFLAPSLPYGADFAEGFAGAINLTHDTFVLCLRRLSESCWTMALIMSPSLTTISIQNT